MRTCTLEKVYFSLIFTLFLMHSSPVMAQDPGETHTVPLGGNTWVYSDRPSRALLQEAGIVNWGQQKTSFKTFFRVNTSGILKLWINASVPSGKSKIAVEIAGKAKELTIDSKTLKKYYVGQWQLLDTGYVAVKFEGISKQGDVFAHVSDLIVGGPVVNAQTSYVKNNEGNYFYWGRRGPSVHLGYQVPKDTDIMYYYNEITVPEGEDVIGSYFMANGFSGGYFGIQVNSASERKVLFSVWSPFETDNPEEIPESERIKVLKKGAGVHTGEFGNEGSGGQSYLRYDWKAGNTYKFLLKGEPVGNNHTVYTAWFFAPEEDKWKLIASFSRPKTNSWLTGFHSFLENFIPEQGIYEREVLFQNQWVCDKNGNWTETNRARFTADNTARMGYRMDYAGGVKKGNFYLRNCGFFDNYTVVDTYVERPKSNSKPKIDFDALP